MKPTIKTDSLLASIYTFPGPRGGLVDNRTGKVITAENVQVPSLGYVTRSGIEAAVLRHHNRQLREAQKQPVTSQPKRRELNEVRNAVREEKKRKKQEREAAKKENIEFFNRLDSSNTKYAEKVAEVMRAGYHQKVGAMVRYCVKKGVPVAYVDRYGYYMTLDGITWQKLQGHYETYIRHRAPANRHSRGECMILIPFDDQPTGKSRLAQSRLSISGWTEKEFKIALEAVAASRVSTNS